MSRRHSGPLDYCQSFGKKDAKRLAAETIPSRLVILLPILESTGNLRSCFSVAIIVFLANSGEIVIRVTPFALICRGILQSLELRLMEGYHSPVEGDE